MTSYIPSVIPQEDREALLKLSEGKLRRIGFGKRPAVIVVDMSNAFVEDRYPSGYSRTGIPAARAIGRLLATARDYALPVIYTTGTAADDKRWPAIRGRWAGKSSRNTVNEELLRKHDDIYHEIAPKESDIVIRKNKPSAFFGTQLLSILNYFGVDTIIVTGMVTSGCVRATAVDGFSYNYRVIVPVECVADRSQISHEISLFDLDMKYGDVMKLDEVIASIKSVSQPLRAVTATV